jgi:hypothetical protein
MAKGIEDHVGFFAPQSKQILLASFLFSCAKMVCDSFFAAIAMMGVYVRIGHVLQEGINVSVRCGSEGYL